MIMEKYGPTTKGATGMQLQGAHLMMIAKVNYAKGLIPI